MLFRTHLVFSIFVYFLVSHYVEMPFFVLIFVLISTAFVDIDLKNSFVGNKWYFRPLQFFTRHRGMIHSLLFALILSLIFASFSRWAGFGFFVGYLSHLFLDSFTRRGIRPLWPFDWKIRGFVRSGGILEQIFFVLLLLGDIFIVGRLVFESLF